MTTLRQFTMDDLLKFNNINLDVLTETYNMPFYLSYMSRWPESFSGKYVLLRSCKGLILDYGGKKDTGNGLWIMIGNKVFRLVVNLPFML